MGYGLGGADIFAASAEHDACVGVSYDCSLFSVFLLKFEDIIVAVIYAFPASDALLVVYLWSPRYFVSWNSFKFFFLQTCRLHASQCFLGVGKYAVQ